ncbi:MAG: RNA-directed DNA polymerase [Ignavibacteriae bacterium]|nr:RNA-directed DNA polymerase [Ignavibacteriota bacterium]
MHLNQTHKGLPVGPQFSRPIAELILDDVDGSLLRNRTKYVRYVDDFVIFAKSESDAYKKLAELAQLLYDSRHLKLSELKTHILEAQTFVDRHKPPAATEESSIIDNFNELLSEIGLSTNPYEQLEPDDLNEDDWDRLRAVNLEKVLSEELEKTEPDSFLVSFLLANLARIDNTDAADLILTETNMAKLFPKLHTIMNYLERVRSFSESQRTEIGAKVIKLVTDSFVGQIDFNRMWLLNLFTRSSEWDNVSGFEKLTRRFTDPGTTREVYLALARANAIKFFRSNKSQSLNMDSWVRRAFIAGMSCLPPPERNPWFKARSLRSRDFLDRIVESWVRDGLPPWTR